MLMDHFAGAFVRSDFLRRLMRLPSLLLSCSFCSLRSSSVGALTMQRQLKPLGGL